MQKVLLMLLAASLMVASCRKSNDDVLSTAQKSSGVTAINRDDLPADHSNIKPPNEDDIIDVDLGDGTVHEFNNTHDFEVWAATTEYKDQLITKNNQILDFQAYATAHNVDQVYNETGVVPQEYTDYINSKVKPVPETVLWCILYDGFNYTGAQFFWGLFPLPTMGSFDNRTSSLKGTFGLTAFCDKKWFFGKKLFLIGIPGNGWSFDSTFTNWNNRISSIF